MIDPHLPLSFLGLFGDAINFIIHGQEAETGGIHVGGPEKMLELALTQLKVTGLAMGLGLAIAFPAGVLLGHYGRGELLAVGVGNVGRALPELVIIAICAVTIGVGVLSVTVALTVLAIPPILTNTFVAMRQVDRGVVDAARGMGMTSLEQILRVELPLGVATIMGGIRTATINVVATATIAPLAGVLTLGDLIISRGANGDAGLVAAGICVALLALMLEGLLAVLQRLLTSPGLKLARATA
jgi:osmoprotectant transport system permease protein